MERKVTLRKRDAEQGIVRPVSKNIKKEEMTKTVYGLITSNIKKNSQVCPHCMNELHTWKDCYAQFMRNFCDIEVAEKKEKILTRKSFLD